MFLPVRPEEYLHQEPLKGPAKNADAWLHLGGMNQSENWPVTLNNVPKGLGLVECEDPVGEAVPGPGLQESLRAQTRWALSTPCSLAPESHLSGEGITWQGRGGGGAVPPMQLSQVQTAHLHHPMQLW